MGLAFFEQDREALDTCAVRVSEPAQVSAISPRAELYLCFERDGDPTTMTAFQEWINAHGDGLQALIIEGVRDLAELDLGPC